MTWGHILLDSGTVVLIPWDGPHADAAVLDQVAESWAVRLCMALERANAHAGHAVTPR